VASLYCETLPKIPTGGRLAVTAVDYRLKSTVGSILALQPNVRVRRGYLVSAPAFRQRNLRPHAEDEFRL